MAQRDEEELDELEPDEEELEEELEDEEFDEDFDEDAETDVFVAGEDVEEEDEVIEVSLGAVEETEKAAPGDDEEDEEDVLVRVVSDDDEDVGDDVDGLREGEFICRSCFLAKRPTQLADGKKMLCVDCV